jgi:hypothetical protein
MSKLAIASHQVPAWNEIQGWWLDLWGKTDPDYLINGFFDVSPLDEVVRFGMAGTEQSGAFVSGIYEGAVVGMAPGETHEPSWFHLVFTFNRQTNEALLIHHGYKMLTYIKNYTNCDLNTPGTSLFIGSLPLALDAAIDTTFSGVRSTKFVYGITSEIWSKSARP